jgi:hypothetical protein
VEPQGVEPWSREDDNVRSTCLVDFDCRDGQGRQQPKPILSCCCLDRCAQQRNGPVHAFDTAGPSPRNEGLGDDGLPDLIGDKLDLTLGQIKQPWRKLFRHLLF